jgi:hypothetical protein
VRKLLVVMSITAALTACGGASNNVPTGATSLTGEVATSPPAPTCIDTVSSILSPDQVASALDATKGYISERNIAAAAHNLRSMAALFARAETNTAADPAISEPMAEASMNFGEAADAIEAGRSSEATGDMKAGSTAVDRAAAAIQTTTVPEC